MTPAEIAAPVPPEIAETEMAFSLSDFVVRMWPFFCATPLGLALLAELDKEVTAPKQSPAPTE